MPVFAAARTAAMVTSVAGNGPSSSRAGDGDRADWRGAVGAWAWSHFGILAVLVLLAAARVRAHGCDWAVILGGGWRRQTATEKLRKIAAVLAVLAQPLMLPLLPLRPSLLPPCDAMRHGFADCCEVFLLQFVLASRAQPPPFPEPLRKLVGLRRPSSVDAGPWMPP